MLVGGVDSPSLLYVVSCRSNRELESYLAEIGSEFFAIERIKLGPLSRSESLELGGSCAQTKSQLRAPKCSLSKPTDVLSHRGAGKSMMPRRGFCDSEVL